MYHRLVMPYQQLPFVLVNLIDPEFSDAAKQRLSTWFWNLPRCCLCQALCQPLKDHVASERDLRLGSGVKILQAVASTKTTNIEVENNFARAGSHSTGKGRNEFAQGLSAKHVLAEVKLLHRRSLQRCSLMPESGDSQQVPIEDGSQPGASGSDLGDSLVISESQGAQHWFMYSPEKGNHGLILYNRLFQITLLLMMDDGDGDDDDDGGGGDDEDDDLMMI